MEQQKHYVPPFLRNQDNNHSSGHHHHNNNNHHHSSSNNHSSSYNNNSSSSYDYPKRFKNLDKESFVNPSNHHNWRKPTRYNPYDRSRTRYSREEKEIEELFENSMNSGINFDKYEDIPVQVKGSSIPSEIDSFKSLPSALLKNIERAKYDKPTPVQKYSIPIGMAKRDLMACAQTGSGKTASFLFPIIADLLNEGLGNKGYNKYNGYNGGNEPVAPQSLILSPTRELTTQIYDEARKFTYQTGLRTVVVYGGSSIHVQIRNLKYGCNILVATPGRLVDLIQRGEVTLKDVRFFVLDEADRMLDMGFEPQIKQIVEDEKMPGVDSRQTMMFSATFPKDIQILASKYLKNYIFLAVGRVGSTTDNITQIIEFVKDDEKDEVLTAVLKKKPGRTLVFTRTKRDCEKLQFHLMKIGIGCESIHGDRSQREREYALSSFKSGKVTVLVATDVASRGLDINDVCHVVNYDMPDNIDSYIHRIGRTGRVGHNGLATSFFNQDCVMIAKDLVKILKECSQDIPSWLPKYADMHARAKAAKKKKKNFGSNKYNKYGNNRYNSYGKSNGYSKYSKYSNYSNGNSNYNSNSNYPNGNSNYNNGW